MFYINRPCHLQLNVCIQRTIKKSIIDSSFCGTSCAWHVVDVRKINMFALFYMHTCKCVLNSIVNPIFPGGCLISFLLRHLSGMVYFTRLWTLYQNFHNIPSPARCIIQCTSTKVVYTSMYTNQPQHYQLEIVHTR